MRNMSKKESGIMNRKIPLNKGGVRVGEDGGCIPLNKGVR